MAALMLLWGAALGAQRPVPPPSAATAKTPAAADTAKAKVPAAADTAKAKAAATSDTTKAKSPPGRDTTKVDSATARRRRLAADTVKAPLAHAEMPIEAGGAWHWSGEQLRSTGAVSLADVLLHIPGATGFRANWIPAPQFIAYNGDAGRVRVFRDGVEIDAIDPRNGQVLDLAVIPIWQLEEVSVERAPGELRVHLRSWRVQKTIPFTRTDITTGSENTNLYRGYFGKRFHNGAVIQMAAQQYATTSPRTGGDGSSLQVFGRVGWAWKQLSVDGVWNRMSIDRAATVRFPLRTDSVSHDGAPSFKGSIGSSYARVAWGDPDAFGAPWVQLIAATQTVAENSKVSETSSLTNVSSTASTDTADAASADTATSRSQYVMAAGLSRWGLSASATARMRIVQHQRVLSPSMRLGYDWRFVSLAAYAETKGADSTQRMDVNARIAPWRWLVLSGAYGSYNPKSAVTGGPKFTASRVNLSSTLFGVTLSGGMITRGMATLAAPVTLDSALVRVGTGEVKGVSFATHGPIWRDFGFDVSGVRWESSGAYRPQMEIHSALYFDSSFPKRLPRNNFHLFASATYDHRTPMFFPTATGMVGQSTGPTDALGAQIEIRIESGTVFFRADNMVGKVYETAPGYMMPRRMQYYGLRWDFWN